jgi:hypothetical protein
LEKDIALKINIYIVPLSLGDKMIKAAKAPGI